MVTPYEGLRVIDLSTRLSGAFAARLFGDFGADVFLCEDEDGHCLRHLPPFENDQEGMEASVTHAYFNWNKKSLGITQETQLEEILNSADVIITTNPDPDYLSKIREEIRSDSVHLSVTAHGIDDPLSSVPGNNLTMSARVGWASINGFRDEPPLAMPRDQSGVVGGLTGFITAAAALRRRNHGASAELVDVSELEAFALTVHPWGVAAVYNSTGGTRSPGGGRRRGDPAPLWDLSDGRMNFGLADFHNWTAAMEVMNLPELGARPELIPDFGRHSKDMRDVVWGMARTLPELKRWDVFHALAKLRCVIGVVQDTDDLLQNEHLNAREYFDQTEINGKVVRTAGAPAKLHPSPWQIHRPAPKYGADSIQVKQKSSPTSTSTSTLNQEQLADGPLSGIRVLSFGQAWSGTFATELLAFLGADVVQIATEKRPDAFRRISNRVPIGVQNDSIEQYPPNTQGHYNSVNLHKREINLDMSTEAGLDLFWRLVPNFDMLVDNFRPNVLPRWGVTLEKLHELRPGMIWASISGYGESGPYKDYPANGATTEPMAGFSAVHGYEGDSGGMNTGGLFPDPISGYSLVATIMAALAHRELTGEPQRVDLSMMEAVTTVIGDTIIECEANAEVPQPRGNRHLLYAPHNMYKTRDGTWIALAVESNKAWFALKQYVGDSRLEHARYESLSGRKQHEDELDHLLGAWVGEQDASQLENELGQLGVCCAKVIPLYDVYSTPDPHFVKAGFIQQIEHPEAGKTWLPGRPWRYSLAESTAIRPAPCVGEHSFEVFNQELGMEYSEYQRLVADGISGTLSELSKRPKIAAN